MLGKLVAVWHGIVWYLREISGEARYDHYLEHFAAEHPGETPMSEVEFIRAREEYDRLHPKKPARHGNYVAILPLQSV